MFKRFFAGVALLCLIAVPVTVRAADAQPASPTVVVRVAAIDDLLADVKYLAALGGREEEAKQFEALIRAQAGPKGLEGFDTKKPIGFYGMIGPSGIDSTAVGLIPIADEKAVLALLERLNMKAEQGDDGVYTVNPPNSPLPAYFRFANKYAYVTARDKSAIDKDKLLDPSKVLPPGKTGAVSASFHIDQIPDGLKQIAIQQLDLQIANAKEQKDPNESETQQKIKAQTLDQMGASAASLIKDGGEFSLRFDIDRKKHEMILEMSLSGKPNTRLAEHIAKAGQAKSLFGGLVGADSAFAMLAHASVPDSIRKAFVQGAEEGFKQSLEKEKDPAKRELATKIFKILEPSLQSGELDLAFDLRRYTGSKHYTLVGGIKIKNGDAVEKLVRDMVKDLPASEKDKIKLDADKAGAIGIHRLEIQKDSDEATREHFGENPAFVAFRHDAVFLAMGEKGLTVLKEALAAPVKVAAPFRMEVSFARMADLMTKEHPGAVKAAKEIFAQDKGGDKMYVTIEGGTALRVRFDMKTTLVKFFSLLEKEGKASK